jgi:hypothetical protein
MLVTVSVDELPLVTEVGLALIVTVGGGFDTTVTVTVAVLVPPVPVAVTVYTVVAFGLTASAPPVAERVVLLPSLPATTTCVACAATTVRIEEAPL